MGLVPPTVAILIYEYNTCSLEVLALASSPRARGTAAWVRSWPIPQLKEFVMDKDRVEGSLKQAKGAVKDAAGKLTGDSKLQAEGKADKAEGKIQNAVGGVKDALRGK
jgi:uncharacterized protein YjbJ (UPF0337 family)